MACHPTTVFGTGDRAIPNPWAWLAYFVRSRTIGNPNSKDVDGVPENGIRGCPLAYTYTQRTDTYITYKNMEELDNTVTHEQHE